MQSKNAIQNNLCGFECLYVYIHIHTQSHRGYDITHCVEYLMECYVWSVCWYFITVTQHQRCSNFTVTVLHESFCCMISMFRLFRMFEFCTQADGQITFQFAYEAGPKQRSCTQAWVRMIFHFILLFIYIVRVLEFFLYQFIHFCALKVNNSTALVQIGKSIYLKKV